MRQIFLFIGLFLILLLSFSGKNLLASNVDSLKSESQTQKGLTRANTLVKIVDYYHNIDIDSSLVYAHRLENLSDSLNFIDGKLAATTSYINADFVRGFYSSGIEKSIPFSNIQLDHPSFHLANLYLATGNCYGSLGLYKSGVEYYLKSRSIFSKLGDTEKLNTISNNLGAFYIRLGNYEAALDVFEDMNQSGYDIASRVTYVVNMGFIYLGLNDHEKAESYFLSVLDFNESAVEIRAKAISTYKLGNLYTEQKSYDKALQYYDRSLGFYSKLNNKAQTMNPLNGIAEVYFLLGDNKKAKEQALKSEVIGEETQTLLELNQIVNLLSSIYASEGNFRKAYEYSTKSRALNDSLNISQRNQELQLMEAEYEFEKREEELKIEQTARLDKQRLLIGGISSFLLASLIFVFVVYRSKRNKEKANLRLENLNHDLEETNKIKNQLFSIIAHDLRNPLTSLYGLVTLLEMKAANREELEKLIPELVTQFKHTSTLLNNLLNWSKSQMNGYKVLPIEFDINEVFKSNYVILKSRFQDKSISLEINSDSPAKVFADKNMIDLVVLNLLSNALKYCDEGDSVTINSSVQKNMLVTEVKDTGVGIPKDKSELLFTNSFYSTSGTRNEKGTGLGLMLCKEFIERNNGAIWVESEFGIGTTFFFKLPVSK